MSLSTAMALFRIRHYLGNVFMEPALLNYAAQVAQAVSAMTVGFLFFFYSLTTAKMSKPEEDSQ